MKAYSVFPPSAATLLKRWVLERDEMAQNTAALFARPDAGPRELGPTRTSNAVFSSQAAGGGCLGLPPPLTPPDPKSSFLSLSLRIMTRSVFPDVDGNLIDLSPLSWQAEKRLDLIRVFCFG